MRTGKTRGRSHGTSSISLTSWMVVATLPMLAGCMMVGPDYQRPAPPVAKRWIARDATGIAREAEPIGPWWETFGDPILSDLVAEAYRQNPSLQAAGGRVIEAHARRGIAIGTLFPQVAEHEQQQIADDARHGTEQDCGWWRWRWWRPQG